VAATDQLETYHAGIFHGADTVCSYIMHEVEYFLWQFKQPEPGKRVRRVLGRHMDAETARERYGDAIEPVPGTREVRRIAETAAEKRRKKVGSYRLALEAEALICWTWSLAAPERSG
jgi:hypothetical protein